MKDQPGTGGMDCINGRTKCWVIEAYGLTVGKVVAMVKAGFELNRNYQ